MFELYVYSLFFGPQSECLLIGLDEFFYFHLVKLFSVSVLLSDGRKQLQHLFRRFSRNKGRKAPKRPSTGADLTIGNTYVRLLIIRDPIYQTK
jgi:hypothetical protein